MSYALLEDITKKVNKMEEKGEVDLIIIKDLEKLQQKLIQTENKIVKNDHKDSFYFYQSIRNVQLVLERIVKRFLESKQKHDNPQIALDTLALIPIASDIVQLTEGLKMDTNTIDKILERTHQLRDKAAETNLIEFDDRNLQDIDSKKLGKTFDKIMEDISIPADLPNDIQIDEDEDEDIS